MRMWNIVAVAALAVVASSCGKAHITISSIGSSTKMQTVNGLLVATPSMEFIGDRYSPNYQATFNVTLGSDSVALVTYPTPTDVGSAVQYVGNNVYAVRVECSPSVGCSKFTALLNYGVSTSPNLSQFAAVYQQDTTTGAITKLKEVQNGGFNTVEDAMNQLGGA